MVLLLRIPFFRLPLTCCQDEEISSVVFLLTCFSSRCASRGTKLYIQGTKHDLQHAVETIGWAYEMMRDSYA